MKAACQNATPMPEHFKLRLPGTDGWCYCGFIGEVPSLESECPRCHNKGRLVAVDVPGKEHYHAEWCDRMNGGPECNCDIGKVKGN